MPHLDINGASLFFTDDPGVNLPVLLVHGFTCDSSDWVFQIPALRAAGHRVVTLDLRGHGRSSIPSSGYAITGLASDLREMCRALAIGQCAVVGHSLGGAVALRAAASYPDWTVGVCAIDFEFATTEELAVAEQIAKMPPGDGPLEELCSFFAVNAYTSSSPPWLREFHRRRVLGLDSMMLARSFADQKDEPEPFLETSHGRQALGQIKCPVLILRRDSRGLAEDLASLTASPDVQGLEFADNGHWLHQERAEEINDLLISWLGDLTAEQAVRAGA